VWLVACIMLRGWLQVYMALVRRGQVQTESGPSREDMPLASMSHQIQRNPAGPQAATSTGSSSCLHSVTSPLVITTPEGTVLDVNDTTLRVFGYAVYS